MLYYIDIDSPNDARIVYGSEPPKRNDNLNDRLRQYGHIKSVTTHNDEIIVLHFHYNEHGGKESVTRMHATDFSVIQKYDVPSEMVYHDYNRLISDKKGGYLFFSFLMPPYSITILSRMILPRLKKIQLPGSEWFSISPTGRYLSVRSAVNMQLRFTSWLIDTSNWSIHNSVTFEGKYMYEGAISSKENYWLVGGRNGLVIPI